MEEEEASEERERQRVEGGEGDCAGAGRPPPHGARKEGRGGFANKITEQTHVGAF